MVPARRSRSLGAFSPGHCEGLVPPRRSGPATDHPPGPPWCCGPSASTAQGAQGAFISLQNGNSQPATTWRGHNQFQWAPGKLTKFPHRCLEDFAPLGVTQPTLKLLFQPCLCARVSKNRVQFCLVDGLGPASLWRPPQGPAGPGGMGKKTTPNCH